MNTTAGALTEQVILVNCNDEIVGSAEKLEAHLKGARHRAFSIFIFRSDGRLLLQQRASGKYHSGGLWTNTCCGHPRPGETTDDAASRRLKEEMGLTCALRKVFSFDYRIEISDGLTEDEIDHVFVGLDDSVPVLNPDEASAWRAVSIMELTSEMERNPQNYTGWFPLALKPLLELSKGDLL